VTGVIVTATTTTRDAFHRGAFHLVQPARKGHRAGTDAMMLAAAVPDGFSGRVADLGAGAGAAGLAVLSRCAHASAVLVERSTEMAFYARATLELPGNANFRDRAEIIEIDVTAPGKTRHQAGLEDNSFDFAIMNPPFNHAHDRRTPDDLKAEAHVMDDNLFERWMRTAAALVKPRGGLAIIARPQSLSGILAATSGRFGALRVKPVLSHGDRPAIRVIVTGIRGSRAGLSLEPALVLHEAGGDRFTDHADAINNGRAGLFDHVN
jgi:tRNA1(Val) A37 N6-methylase TrmN6